MATMASDEPPQSPPRDDTKGRCALCHREIVRYGPAGRPLCGECETKRVTEPR